MPWQNLEEELAEAFSDLRWPSARDIVTSGGFRFTSSATKAKQNESAKARYQANREAILARQKARYQAKKEAGHKSTYYQRNKEKVLAKVRAKRKEAKQ